MWKKFSGIILIIIATLFFVFEANKDKYYIAKANFCLKKNEVICAQEYFEKAFLIGYNSQDERDKYVNLLINFPFTIEAQEKALKFLEIDIEDSAKLKLESFIHDLKLEIFRKYPSNFVKQAPYSQKIMRWGKLPITYSITREKDVAEYYEKEIESAFNEWEKALEHTILFEKTDKDSNITIELKANNPANKKYDKFVSAYTTPNVFNDKLLNMDIIFYTIDPFAKKMSKIQLYNTALHEIAHALGVMGHSRDTDDIMYMTKEFKPSKKESRDILQEGDVNTIKLLYKIKPEITNSKILTGEYLPEIVIGDDSDISRVKMEEAKSYIKKVPTVVAGYIDLADSYVNAKDYSRAIRALEHALQIADSDEILEMIYFNLALAYFYDENFELAKMYIDKSIKYENTINKRFLLAEIYSKLGNFDSAEKEYKYLILQDSNNPEYVIALINLYITKKENLKARVILKEYFKNNPQEKKNPRFEPYGILKFGL